MPYDYLLHNPFLVDAVRLFTTESVLIGYGLLFTTTSIRIEMFRILTSGVYFVLKRCETLLQLRFRF